MIYILKLAMKNIARAKRRTLLTFLMLSFGIIIYLMMEGMLEGFDRASFQNYIEFETGHYKIRSTAFDEDHPYDPENYIKDTNPVIQKISKMDFVTGYTSRVIFLAQLDNTIDSSPVVLVGVDPQRDSTVFTLNRYITNGKIEQGGVVIGSLLARDMNVTPGDLVYATFRDNNGMYTSIELIISGLITSADPKVNSGMAFIDIKDAKAFMDVPGVTEIAVKIKNFKRVDDFQDTITAALPGYRVESWKELSTDFAALMSTKRKAGSYFLLFIVIIALVGIINTLLMSVYEKRQEIGTLMALGMEHSDVRNIFIFEGFIIGLFGSIFGLFLGTLVNLYMIYVGIDYTAMVGESGGGFNVIGVVKSAWVISSYLKATLLVITASVLSSYYPAKKVMSMSPAQCLRTVQ